MGTRNEHFVEQGGQDMMCAIKFEKCVVCDSIWTWCRLFVRLAEDTAYITWSDECTVKVGSQMDELRPLPDYSKKNLAISEN